MPEHTALQVHGGPRGEWEQWLHIGTNPAATFPPRAGSSLSGPPLVGPEPANLANEHWPSLVPIFKFGNRLTPCRKICQGSQCQNHNIKSSIVVFLLQLFFFFKFSSLTSDLI